VLGSGIRAQGFWFKNVGFPISSIRAWEFVFRVEFSELRV
jgi:hypothetical protein